MNRLAPLATLLALLLALSACGAAPQEEAPPAGDSSPAEEAVTLEDLYGADYQAYLIDTITMQMGNRMDKTPDIRYFPIVEQRHLSDYVSIGEQTKFEMDKNGNPVIFFPAGTVTDAEHGEQSFIIPKLYQ